MVGAEDVEQPAAAALELVAVVGDVGEEVGGLAARPDQHPVLVVAELRGAQPGCAVGLVERTALAQLLDERVESVPLVQRALREPRVELHPVALQGRLSRVAHLLRALRGEHAEVVRADALRLQLVGEVVT